MSGVQTSADGPTDPAKTSKVADPSKEDDQLTTGPIEPGEDAKEIEEAKKRRFAADGDNVQGQEPAVNIQ